MGAGDGDGCRVPGAGCRVSLNGVDVVVRR